MPKTGIYDSLFMFGHLLQSFFTEFFFLRIFSEQITSEALERPDMGETNCKKGIKEAGASAPAIFIYLFVSAQLKLTLSS